MKQFIFFVSVVAMLVSCDFEKMKSERLAAKLAMDSLREEVLTHQHLSATLLEVSTLLDSIDASRHLLKTNMLEGTDEPVLTSRLRDINRYVQATESKIKSLEQKQAKNKSNPVYQAALTKLRSELDIRNQEVTALKEQVSAYEAENHRLSAALSSREIELQQTTQDLKQKQAERDDLDKQVKELLVQAEVDKGEALFLRAEAVEETAHRTHFAPRKKKRTRAQAIELYRLALACGNTGAQSRIDALEK